MKKKLLTWFIGSIALMSMTVAISGGVKNTNSIDEDSIYLEANLGYALIDWRSYALGITNFKTGAASRSNTIGGFSIGSVAGYQFDDYWSVEVGWYHLPTVKGTANNISAVAKGWFTYAAAKLSVPIRSIYLFGKVGVAVRGTCLSANVAALNTYSGQVLPISAYYGIPVFAVGFQYYFVRNWSVSAQYLRVPGYQKFVSATSTSRLNVPAVNLLTTAISIKINV